MLYCSRLAESRYCTANPGPPGPHRAGNSAAAILSLKCPQRRSELDLDERARDLILHNYEATGGSHVAPAPPHYFDPALWDACFHAEVCASLSRLFSDEALMQLAKNEINQFLNCQRQDGFIPHTIYHGKTRRLKRGFLRPITQPPVLAQAVKAVDDPEWTREVLPAVLRFYLYFRDCRDADGDSLVSVRQAYESGRDTSPEFDLLKGKAARPLGFVNMAARLRRLDVEDLVTNCLWIQGLRVLAGLCHEQETRDALARAADKAEQSMYDLCWDEDHRMFFPLDSHNRKLMIPTIAGLYPLILDNIPQMMSDNLLEHLTDPREFWTEYPFPSLPTNSPHFNCHRQYYGCCNWRGPVWINTNRHIVEGLAKHGYQDVAARVAEANCDMVDREGFWEYYHPSTGRGMRIRSFAWSTQVVLYPEILHAGIRTHPT